MLSRLFKMKINQKKYFETKIILLFSNCKYGIYTHCKIKILNIHTGLHFKMVKDCFSLH